MNLLKINHTFSLHPQDEQKHANTKAAMYSVSGKTAVARKNQFAFNKIPEWTTRFTIGERSFQSAAASTWNALPRSVRSSTSVFQFRSRLKTELFARSYQQSY